MNEKECESWHNTTCSILSEVNIFMRLKYLNLITKYKKPRGTIDWYKGGKSDI